MIHKHFISHGGKGFADGEIERACILFIFGGKPFAKLCHLPQRGIGRAEDCESGQLRFFPFYGNGLLCGLDTIRKPNPGKLIGFDAVGINAVHACGKSILKDAVTIDGMGIDLEPLCLQLGDIFLLCTVDMQGDGINAVCGTEIRDIVIIWICIKIQGENPVFKGIDFLDPAEHFFIVQLRNDAAQNFGRADIIGDIHQIAELPLHLRLIGGFGIRYEVHIWVFLHEIEQIHRCHGGLLIDRRGRGEGFGIHHQRAARLDFQTIIGAILFKIVPHDEGTV